MGKSLLVTGGAGFIGSALVRALHAQGHSVTVLDAFNYAGLMENLEGVGPARLSIQRSDLRDMNSVRQVISSAAFDGVFHLAAESHVDNSILGPRIFFETNVLGTLNLLEAAREALKRGHFGPDFRLVHVSTDEVFGSLGDSGHFTERSSYAPRSPYSASKAASDHIAQSWHHTYGLPVIITNCSNNFGPRQFPEKFIPRMITNALQQRRLPVYGTGKNVRDWIHVDDHCRGLLLAFQRGRIGESYLFGGRSERHNLQVVHQICSILDQLKPRSRGQYRDLIEMVSDRPGHDFRYAIDCTKAERDLGFRVQTGHFETALKDTVSWYLNNSGWLEAVERKHAEKAG